MAMNGGNPMGISKHKASGLMERRFLLEREYGSSVGRLEKRAAGLPGVKLDDLYDALATLWTAQRHHRGEAGQVSTPTPLDTYGIPMQIAF